MAIDKAVDSAQLDAALTATANAIREKAGNADACAWDASTGFASLIAAIQAGGGGGVEGYQIVSGSYAPAETTTSPVVLHTTNVLGLQNAVKEAIKRCVFLAFVEGDNENLNYPTPFIQCYKTRSCHYSWKSSGSGSSTSLGANITYTGSNNKYAIEVQLRCNSTYSLAPGNVYVWMLLVPNDIEI